MSHLPASDGQERKITIGALMQFRQSLTFMKRRYPFLPGESAVCVKCSTASAPHCAERIRR